MCGFIIWTIGKGATAAVAAFIVHKLAVHKLICVRMVQKKKHKFKNGHHGLYSQVTTICIAYTFRDNSPNEKSKTKHL